ncbi:MULTISPECIES: hypothetical protein [Cupriavidus]|uniref:Uncharacterized protein n=1 Tax=Cupriavidus basilensis TaxID=68895 RepID=A0A643FZK5_9BURK|nr:MULTISPECIES: hypothetical protein [Cupriavidus]MBB1629863.1 hypothetical protein [Cupriavidus sp. UME77]MCP3021699.1 hypothetical protein [Cupriavidus basilensis]MDR3380248.1 hypothetical protein [Cupriavidus basilensis]QOT81093.1 hypothetical protein F7R26_027455 [Cupriavidus basilensis]
MLKKVISIAALSLLAAGQAHALPSLGSLTGGSSSSSSGATADASGAQDQLSKAYVAAGREVLVAQSYLADAVGLKELSAKAKATADALTDGATKGNLEDSDKLQSEASAAIEAKLKDSNTKIDAAGKQSYAEGMKHLGLGVLRYVGLRPSLIAFKDAAQSQLTSASVMEKLTLTNKLSTGTYIASEAPGHVTRLGSTLQAATAYAKSNEIPVPKDATAALSAKF